MTNINLYLLFNFIVISMIIFRALKRMLNKQHYTSQLYWSLGLLLLEVLLELGLMLLKKVSGNALLGLLIGKIALVLLPQLFSHRQPEAKQQKSTNTIQYGKSTEIALQMIKHLANDLGPSNKKLLQEEAQLFFNHQDHLSAHNRKDNLVKEFNLEKSDIQVFPTPLQKTS